ncbi:GDSL-type esterase/lipase family protein [Cellulomonas fimi]|uniref:DUF459 domain-containing protein n=1 Tax=Cellulomonas fimi TaxID=1708 RepID=UPI00234C2F9E|nr:GDSL-type esterase/lipase family protein [Cellulomonas fimi]MDC7122780.1 GDSL-type esterase/lipase family protein [Cellulomonas fimi]
MTRLTVLFLGDSFVAGVGDPTALGWTGRLLAATHRPDRDLTGYVLGVRRETSDDVLSRWEREADVRLPGVGVGAVVVSFGVNDATLEDGRRRVPEDRTGDNLRRLVEGARARDLAVLVVGPPPIADDDVDARLVALDAHLHVTAAAVDVPYVPTVGSLLDDPVWRAEVAAGDGAHPGAAGYARLAALVRPSWDALVEDLTA